MKLLVVLVVVVLGLWLLLRGRGSKPASPPEQAPPGRPGSPAEPTTMIACVRCGLHLPRQEALADAQGRLFCSGDHRDAGPG